MLRWKDGRARSHLDGAMRLGEFLGEASNSFAASTVNSVMYSFCSTQGGNHRARDR